MRMRHTTVTVRGLRAVRTAQKKYNVAITTHGSGCYMRTDGTYSREWTAAEYETALIRRRAWASIPRLIRRAIRTAYGGNRTFIQCEVPGYSSRFRDCVARLCRECGISKKQLAERLLTSGIRYVCGHPIPQQWMGG